MHKNIRIIIILIALMVVLFKFGNGVLGMNKIRAHGETMLLQLRPVDPRSFMKGDYMALAYHEDAYPKKVDEENILNTGTLVLLRGKQNVAKFTRFDDGSELEPREVLVRYSKGKWGRFDIGVSRYYFQEGTAKTYEPAKYGVFKVSQSGYMVLTDLVDENFNILAPIGKDSKGVN